MSELEISFIWTFPLLSVYVLYYVYQVTKNKSLITGFIFCILSECSIHTMVLIVIQHACESTETSQPLYHHIIAAVLFVIIQTCLLLPSNSYRCVQDPPLMMI